MLSLFYIICYLGIEHLSMAGLLIEFHAQITKAVKSVSDLQLWSACEGIRVSSKFVIHLDFV